MRRGHRWMVLGRLRWLTFCGECYVTYRTHRHSPRHRNACPA